MGPDTSASVSCSASLNGELFVFGGHPDTKQVIFTIRKMIKSNSSFQISKILDCELKRIGDLPIEFYYGACGTFLFDGVERVMLCFALKDKKKCIRLLHVKYFAFGCVAQSCIVSINIASVK